MWNHLTETILREFGEKASVLRILHLRASQRLVMLDRWLLVPALLSSTASAAIGATFDPENEHWKYIAACLALGSTMLTALNKHMRLSERSDMHRKSASMYGKTYRHITTELAFNRDHRSKADEFLKKVRHSLDVAGEEAPIIERAIVRDFLSEFSNKDSIALPEVCNGLSRIRIRGGESPDSQHSVPFKSTDVHLCEADSNRGMDIEEALSEEAVSL